MFDTSKDILWFAIALSVIVFTAFLSWTMYQVGKLLRQSNEIVHDVREKIATLTDMLTSIGDRVNKSAATITTLAHGVEQAVDFIKTKRNKRPRGKSQEG